MGAEDHVVPLGQYATAAEAARLGDFVALSAAAAQDIPRLLGAGPTATYYPLVEGSSPSVAARAAGVVDAFKTAA